MTTELLAQVTYGTVVAGFVIRNGVVVDAAPILWRKLICRNRNQVREIAKDQGWRIRVVYERPVEKLTST